MRWKFVLATLFLVAGVPVFSQSDPAAIMSSLQVNAGFGLSAYRDDFEGPGIMEGSTLWFDVYPHRGPKLLEGFGVDIEVRDIDFGRPPTQPSNLREVTGGGGLIYSWRHFHNLNPYGKVDWEVAGIDFHAGNPRYNYDTRNLSACLLYTSALGVGAPVEDIEELAADKQDSAPRVGDVYKRQAAKSPA